ncbi:MAG: metal ABC transporter permease [Planctomycetaceae bacterium]
MNEFFARLATWDGLDTWATATAAVAAVACAVPGVFLVLRRQALLGDALSHTALPGVVGAYLVTTFAERAGVLPEGTFAAARLVLLAAGAIVVGLLTAWTSETLARFGRIDRTTSLAVVFTTAFAAGLLLLRWQADAVHIDPDHVLFGEVELTVLDTVGIVPWDDAEAAPVVPKGTYGVPAGTIPRALAVAAAALLVNALFIAVCFKELRLAAFDVGFAESIGLNTRRLHLVQVALTAVTLVAAFESVGSILAIAMLVLPAAAARFLSDRLLGTLLWSAGLAVLAAIVGHAASFTLPPVLFGAMGFDTVEDVGTAGAMAAVGGAFFLLALLFGPKGGVVTTRLAHSAHKDAEGLQSLGVPV